MTTNSTTAGSVARPQVTSPNAAVSTSVSLATSVTLSHFQQPPTLAITQGPEAAVEWRDWRQRWNSYALVTGLAGRGADVQEAMLVMSMNKEALLLYNALPSSDKVDMKSALDALGTHSVGSVNRTFERFQFSQRAQQDGESFDHYLMVLRTLIQTGQYGTLSD